MSISKALDPLLALPPLPRLTAIFSTCICTGDMTGAEMGKPLHESHGLKIERGKRLKEENLENNKKTKRGKVRAANAG